MKTKQPQHPLQIGRIVRAFVRHSSGQLIVRPALVTTLGKDTECNAQVFFGDDNVPRFFQLTHQPERLAENSWHNHTDPVAELYYQDSGLPRSL